MKPVLLDSGVIVASLDRNDRLHGASMEAVESLGAVPLVTCEAVISESCYLLRRVAGAQEALLDNIVNGVFQIPLRLSESAVEVRRLMGKYRDRHADLADVCLIHLANEFQTGDILTLDRDFEVYRWGRHNRFNLLVRLHSD